MTLIRPLSPPPPTRTHTVAGANTTKYHFANKRSAPMGVSLYVSLSLCVSLAMCLSRYVSVSLCVCLSMCMCLFLCLSRVSLSCVYVCVSPMCVCACVCALYVCIQMAGANTTPLRRRQSSGADLRYALNAKLNPLNA